MLLIKMSRTPEQTYIDFFHVTINRNTLFKRYGEEDISSIISFIKKRIPNYLKTNPEIVGISYSMLSVKEEDFISELDRRCKGHILGAMRDEDALPLMDGKDNYKILAYDVLRFYRMLL